jgi:hypothetical protein
MFYTIYTSSDYEGTYNYTANSNNIITNGNDHNSCIICWTTDTHKNRLQYLKDFNEYVISCDCNVLIHHDCLKKWIQNTNSCPICRKKISENLIINNNNNNNNNFTIMYYYICYKYILRAFRVVSIVFVLKITLIIVYNIYYEFL